ncbi:hypothetical protein BP5796_12594 [Coleophoma crateriformis]|uniref:HRQ family protein 2 n=1 Tax=Coleophoma crateriformis TaxID=565419 RepID=A0A3D8Q7J6_9HELO|nr:hypothetical protein BP5796_12594 [Coleophoma crateriformis]
MAALDLLTLAIEQWNTLALLLAPGSLALCFWIYVKQFNGFSDQNKISKKKAQKCDSFKSMGAIEPLTEFDWKTQEEERIYKFNPKYFLTMGLQNTDINWITHIDKQFAERLSERQRILDTHPAALGCEPNAVPMVNELYEYLVQEYFPRRYPTIFKLTPAEKPTHIINTANNDKLPLEVPGTPMEALRLLAVNIDEDFLMLLPSLDGDGYSLQSFVWCYPVGFSPADKLGLKLREAHKPVPAYKEKLQTSMDRYFSRLEPGKVVYRVNWAVATSSDLCVDGEYHLYEGQEVTDTRVDMQDCWIRCELQTLFALPKTRGRILSVHLYLYPLQEIKDQGLGEQMIEAIQGLKEGNAPGFWRYKRAPVWQDQVTAFLRS